MSGGFSVEPADDLPLHEAGEPLVQPEVLEVVVRHQVTRPRVRDLELV